MEIKWNTDIPLKYDYIFGQYRTSNGWSNIYLYWWDEIKKGWICKEEKDTIHFFPPDRWKERSCETEIILKNMLQTIKKIADLAETLPITIKKLHNSSSNIYEVLDAEFYHNLYKQWSRIYNSIQNKEVANFCMTCSELYDTKDYWLKKTNNK